MAYWIFISDAHLSLKHPHLQDGILNFLNDIEKDLTDLVIVGDLFEFWFGGKGFSFPEYQPLLDKFHDFIKKGINIYYLEGNHDFNMGEIFSNLGVMVYTVPLTLILDGKKLFISHGDLTNMVNLRYKIFRKFLKNPLTYKMLEKLGPTLVKKAASFMSKRSERKWKLKRDSNTPSIFRNFAKTLIENGYDVVILGHSHIPEIALIKTKKKIGLYYNLGDWITNFSYLKYEPQKGFELNFYKHEKKP